VIDIFTKGTTNSTDTTTSTITEPHTTEVVDFLRLESLAIMNAFPMISFLIASLVL
jgi:hypothetical protein